MNIQEAGQERWKRKYVYWIPALHVEGREVAKGRWDAQTVSAALDTWEAAPWTKEDAQTKAVVEKEFQEELQGQKNLPEGVLDFDEPQTPQQYYECVLLTWLITHAHVFLAL